MRILALFLCSFSLIFAQSTKAGGSGSTKVGGGGATKVTATVSTISFSDPFTGTENPLSTGGAWTNGISGYNNMQKSSGTAKAAAAGQGAALVGSPSFLSNPDQEATITIATATSGVGAFVRMDATGAGYLANITSNTVIQIQLMPAGGGAGTLIGSQYVVATVTTGQTVTLRIVGTTLTLYINGILQTSGGSSRTDATIATGSPGIRSGGTGQNIETFSCTSVP